MRTQGVFIIAEAGVNHNGDLETALRLVDVAADAGADAVKFQTFRSDQLASPAAPMAAYQERNTGGAGDQLALVRSLELGAAEHRSLLARCRERGILFMSTPFDRPSMQLLHELGLAIGKVPSGEITNAPYLEAMARTFPDLIVSTGMCTLEEVRAALDVLFASGADPGRTTILHCNTEYPTPLEDVNLLAMRTLAEEFSLPVGLSDHSLGIEVPTAATALGARVIEKHMTLDREMPGPDHRASLEPHEFKAMVRAVRAIERALGTGVKEPTPSERPNIPVARRSIHLARPLAQGSTIDRQDLFMLRPGSGISPMDLEQVVGRRTARDLNAGHLLQWNDLS